MLFSVTNAFAAGVLTTSTAFAAGVLTTSTAFAVDTAAPQGGGPGVLGQFVPLILIFVVFYFLLIRPQQKRAKETKAMLDSLKKGDKIITNGGVYGLVEAVTDDTVTVKIADNVKVKMLRSAVAAIRSGAEE